MPSRLGVATFHSYLQDNRRSAGALLAAARICGDRALIKEAAERFPDDPRVLLDWYLLASQTPAERQDALNALSSSAPGNAIVDYLSALDCFEAGDTDAAVEFLLQAVQKPQAEGYTRDMVQDLEEAYLAAGYTPAQAAATAYYGMPLYLAAPIRELSDRVFELQEQYVRAGDTESAALVAELGALIGAQMQQQMGSGLLMDELTAIAIERRFLHALDQENTLQASDQTVIERLHGLQQRAAEIRAVIPAVQLLTNIDDTERIMFFQRATLQGEVSALAWLQQKHGNAVADSLP